MNATKDITLKYFKFMSANMAVMAMTIISIIGITIGVATLTVAVSIANGFGDAYQKSIVDFNAHVVLLSISEIEDPEAVVEKINRFAPGEVSAANPFIYREGLLIYKGQIRGVVLKGVDPEGVRAISGMDISFEPVSGKDGSGGSGPPIPIVLGSYLASEMGIRPGDKVRVMLPDKWEEEGGGTFKECEVVTTFESGMYDFDSQFALLDLKSAQKIFDLPDTVTGIELKLHDWEESPAWVKKVETVLDYPIYASHWQDLHKSLFEAVKLEKLMFIVVMGSLVIVASFNIIGTVMLRILYKTSDISILRALGMKTRDVKKIFVWQGMIVGLIGTSAGVLVALILIWSIMKYNWVKIPQEVYLLKTLPVCISWTASVMIAAFSLGVCWLTSVMASRKVLDLPIIRGLHRV